MQIFNIHNMTCTSTTHSRDPTTSSCNVRGSIDFSSLDFQAAVTRGGRSRHRVSAVRLRTAEPFVSAFSSVIYKKPVNPRHIPGNQRAAPSPERAHMCVCVPLCLPGPAGMTLILGRSRATRSRFPLLRFGFRLERFNLLLAAESSRPLACDLP